jgi:Transposase IS4
MEQFINCSIADLIRPLPYFEPITMNPHNGRPRNIDLELHWHPLRLFKLFFDWKTMALIAKETNSYAFRNNKAFNLWKTLSIQELYQFFWLPN